MFRDKDHMTNDDTLDAVPAGRYPLVATRGTSALRTNVDVPAGTVVTLEANVTTGYRWEPIAGFTPVLQLIGTADYVARSTDAPVAGAPGDMTFRFRGETAGTTTLEFAYRRPFEANVAAAKTVRYEVTVR